MNGTIYSLTTVRRTPDPNFAPVVPFSVALVELDGVRVLGFLDGDATVGASVHAEFVILDDRALPVFRPAP